jgi:hypothetical protein
MRTEVINWKTFMSGQYRRPTTLQAIAQHVERNKTAYRIGAAVVVFFLASDVSAFAATPLDDKASAVYHDKLLSVFKWALIIKGGWSAAHKALQEDFHGARQQAFSYGTVYLILLSLPWLFNQMDGLFS